MVSELKVVLLVGKLYICATPIGNLEDVTIRLLNTLNQVDTIACEDTRHTVKLLNYYQIKKPLISYHAHSHQEREDYIIEKILKGENIAYVSDAGMPGISDPGEALVKKAILQAIDIEVIPGPSAVITALAISGLDTSSFLFLGFLPTKTKKRRSVLASIANMEHTVIIYEAPHRLLASLNDINDELGDSRPIVVARELTKKFEEIKRGTVKELLEYYSEVVPKGEICILIGKAEEKEEVEFAQIIEEVKMLIAAGVDKKEAFKIKASEYSVKKSLIYNYFVQNED
mgnify:CR=1 FL=1